MDPKASRVFVNSVVSHLKRSLRSYDDKDQDALITTIEEHIRMIKMASTMKKKVPVKSKKVALIPKKKEADAPATVPAVDTASS